VYRYVFWLLFSIGLNASEIKVAVSANVSYAMNDLKKAFMQTNPNTKVQVILASSGKIAAQIQYAAPYDIFLSADTKIPQTLYEAGFSLTQPVVYAQGALVVLSQKERKHCTQLCALQDSDVGSIAIANPKTAPYGKATVEALKNAKLYEKLKNKLVYGESISQALAFTTTAADVGIIAKSLLYAPQMAHFKQSVHWEEVEANLYTPISQGMVILKGAKDNKEAKAFYDFMLSVEAKKILNDFGYSTL
jgi:molybdate transport system substrate-binding protein